jgi:hypothetical protein
LSSLLYIVAILSHSSNIVLLGYLWPF